MAIRIVALVLLVFGAGFLLAARRYAFGSPNAPGPGFLPMILGVAFALLALILLVRPGRPPEQALPPDRAATVRIVATLAFLAAAIVVLDRLGFLVTATLLMLGLLLVLDRRPVRDLLLAPISTVAVYVVFKVWLHVPLPAGVLSF